MKYSATYFSLIIALFQAYLMALIRFYQKHLSHRKGYRCACTMHGEKSCSTHALQALQYQPLPQAVKLIYQRSKQCRFLAQQSGFRYLKLYQKAGVFGVSLAFLTGCGSPEEPKNQSFDVTTAITGAGTASPEKQNIEQGQTASFTLTPAEGQKLESATGCNGTLKDAVFTTGAIQADCQVNVQFSTLKYQVTSTVTGQGTVTPNQQQVEHGKVASFAITAAEGQQLESVTGCNGTLNGETYTTVAIKQACQIEVKFAVKPFPVPVQRIVMDQPSITALNGQLIGGTSFITGKDGGKAAKFGGVDNPSAIRIPNRDSLKFDQEFSFDFWARIDSKKGINGYGQTVEDDGSNPSTNSVHSMYLAKANDDSGWGLRTQNSGAYHHTPQNSSDPSWIPTSDKCTANLPKPNIPIGTWYRVTFVASKATGLRAYANKQLILECKDVKPSFDRMNVQDLYIGRNSRSACSYPLNGAIQDIDVYNVALTDEQVQALPDNEVVIPEPSQKIVLDQASITALGGQLQGSGVSFITGKDGGKAAKFGGVDNPSAIRIPNRDSLKFDQEFSFDLWARMDSKKGMNGYGQIIEDDGINLTDRSVLSALLAKSHDNNGTGFMAFNSGKVANTVTNNPTWGGDIKDCTANLPQPNVPIGTWYRATFVASKTGGIRIYVNKQLISECPKLSPSFDRINTQDLYIGKYSDSWYPLNGAIQDINFYKKALTDAQVQALP